MCDTCATLLPLLASKGDQLVNNDTTELQFVDKNDAFIYFTYVSTWSQRQCNCCFRDPKNFERMAAFTQCLLHQTIVFLREYHLRFAPLESSKESELQKSQEENHWGLDDLEKLLQFVAKALLLNFPLYLAYKHSVQAKLEEINELEAARLNVYCDIHELEISIHLLRNVCLFCKSGGIHAITACFDSQTPESLPINIAHAFVAVATNLKLWLNFRSLQLFIPLRSAVLRYMCKLADKDLRSPGIKYMAEFTWGAVKELVDTHTGFDKDGLDLAFKYFISSTLTMRLAGIAQINNHVGIFNELCNSDNVVEAENLGHLLAKWLIDHKIVDHIFGPNLHVEVIKQSHIILNFLAMEGKLSTEHVEIMWAAAQLKHCGRQVYDLLPSLIRHLEPGPVIHLYHLLSQLPTCDHTEQSLFLASSLIKFIWTNASNCRYGLNDAALLLDLPFSNRQRISHPFSSMENSGSGEESAEEQRNPCRLGPTTRVKERLGTRTRSPGKKTRQKSRPEQQSSDDEDMGGEEEQDDEEEEDEEDVEEEEEEEEDLTDSQGGDTVGEEAEDERSDEENLQVLWSKTALTHNIAAQLVLQEETLIPPLSMLPPKPLSVDEPRTDGTLSSASSPRKRRMPDSSESESGAVKGKKEKESDSEETFKKPLEQSIADSIMDSDKEGSYSSRTSTKSEKNMADFDGEESGCDDELAQLAACAANPLGNAHPKQIASMVASFYQSRLEAAGALATPSVAYRQRIQKFPEFRLEAVCQPGHTLLWDLLQDEKIAELGEGLALEAEKSLCNLLCFTSDPAIRIKFIEGCLENLAKNKAVMVALRLLPKLFASFAQMRSPDTHRITLWADQEYDMVDRFFQSLELFAVTGPTLPIYNHQMEVHVRLQFLSAIYSSIGTPDSFRLSLTQLGCLWQCLASHPQSSDQLFAWLLSQVKRKDQHALGPATFRHLFLELLPQLPAEQFSMTALALFQQLLASAKATGGAGMDLKSSSSTEAAAMNQLWAIALRAVNTDVSSAAIQNLNGFYLSWQLEQEEEFVSRVLESLQTSWQELQETTNPEAILLRVQRALLLLLSHLETFNKKYAYQLRRWALEGRGLSSHAQLAGEKGGATLRIILQAASKNFRDVLELASTDLVADLRAETAVWWEALTAGQVRESEGSLRLLTQGQELAPEYDDRSLQEIGFKDGHIVFVSVGAARGQKRKENVNGASSVNLPRDKLPSVILLRTPYFEQLFSLMQTLSSLTSVDKHGHKVPYTKAQVLSRRVWDILMLLPTNPARLQGLQNLEDSNWKKWLDPACPQKLMYSLYIVEALAKAESDKKSWKTRFIQSGGLKHLFDIFLSGQLQHGGTTSEWQQDALAHLLKILCQLGMVDTLASAQELEVANNEAKTSNNGETGRESPKKSVRHLVQDRLLLIPKLTQELAELMSSETVMKSLSSILHEASFPQDLHHYKTGFWGQTQVVHYALALLVSWVHSSEEVWPLFVESLPLWATRLVLLHPEPMVRRETCSALYRLCIGQSAASWAWLAEGNGSKDGHREDPASRSLTSVAVPLLAHLLDALPTARTMPMHKLDQQDEGKEPYGPACRDYFWFLCRLVEGLDEEFVKRSYQEGSAGLVDLNELAGCVAKSVVTRECLESRHGTVEDEGLLGLLNLATAIFKHNPPFRTSPDGQEFMSDVFQCLFALPHAKQRYLPRCKSRASRSAAYDLLVECVKGSASNYRKLHAMLLSQHQAVSGQSYPWDYWPHEDGRSDCGYVGLTNLGATCYMASCMQHLYMMPQARNSILQAQCSGESRHAATLCELQRMFAYLMESERKAYNPRSFCKVYTMDHQPLNTGEQKDMAEFFIDLVSKLEEMTPELKTLVKNLFCGVISNNVVSLDCNHVSRTIEEFYTVRCQVADMRNLYESLDEVTVKDTLEGDNMYTCSQCGKKVRAEKRACFKKLPHILCFNTMRYTFNMVTMTKEKVNTHFSFPLHLDMSGYVEKNLMPQQYQEEKAKEELGEAVAGEEYEEYQYDLIGVTVHTGTADGGHYYSFIRDRTASKMENWYLFNDAEVKPFDKNQIAAECFGGEMTSKTYDSVTDKFMDFSFEKTNSAYMLFYERSKKNVGEGGSKTSNEESAESAGNDTKSLVTQTDATLELSQELEEWIWQDNVHFLRDRNVFDHAYFSFMWQMCGYVPQTLTPSTEESTKMDITLMSAQLSTSFFLETFIHAKEKPTMVQWVELLTKQFNASRAACEWFMDSMAGDPRWPIHILLKCPNQMVRQMFQRLCIHVIQRLRPQHAQHYLANSASSQQGDEAGSQDDFSTSQELPSREPGSQSCVTRFVKKLLSLMSNGAKAHLKHLNEYFTFLYDFARMGEEECRFLNSVHAISIMVNFYLGQKSQEMLEAASDEEEEEEDERAEEEVVTVPDKVRPTSLDKMVHLIAHLVEKSRGEDQRLHLSNVDMNAVAGGKGFPFLYQQIKDNISLKQTRNLIFSLCRFSDHLAAHIVNMLFQSVTRHSELSGPFFKLLSELVELGGGPPGLPCFTQLVLQRVWEVAEVCPASTLDWLAQHVPRSRLIQAFCLQGLEVWLEPFLLQHNTHRVRAAAAFLVISLVPSLPFRQSFSRTWSGSGSGLMVGLGPAGSLARGGTSPGPHKEINLNPDVRAVLQQVFGALLRLLKRAKTYTDLDTHGIAKLTAYFAVMTHCLVSKLEKLMFRPFFMDLWTLFHPRLSEPAIPVHHNKQALLLFWHQLCVDCPENVALIMQNPTVLRNIAFNYILADHEDQDVVHFNRIMLPAYYGLLRLCCQQSRTFTRQLASHQNVQWAFKNITPYSTQYSAAIEELLKLMQMFVAVRQDTTEQEMQEIITFKRQTMQMYLQVLDGRSCWATLIPAFRILVSSFDDWLFVIFSGGLPTFFEAFHTLHVMYYEATACHVVGDLQEILSLILDLLKTVRAHKDSLKEKQDKEAGTGANQTTNASSASSSASSSTSGTVPGSTSIVANAKEGDEDQNKREKERDARQALLACRERPETIRKIATLLNSYSSPEMRQTCLDILKEWLLLIPSEVLSTLVPLLTHSHSCLQDTCGPYFPTRSKAKAFASPASVLGFGPKAGPTRLGLTGVGGALRPQRPVVQMTLNRSLMEVPKGVDEDYDRALGEYFLPYHQLVDVMCRVAVNHDLMTEALVCLSTTLGREAVLLHFTLFHKFWLDVYQAQHVDRKYLAMLLSNKGLLEAMEAVLKEERVLLNNSIVHNFFSIFLVKVHTPLLSEPFRRLISRLVSSLEAMAATLDVRSPVCVRQLNGDLQALMLVYSTAPLQVPLAPPSPSLVAALQTLLNRAKAVAEKTELPDKAPEEPLSKKARVSGSEGENEATAPRLENNSNPTVADKPANEGSEGKGEVSSSEEEAPPPAPETKESSSKDSSGKPEANTYYAESLVKIIEQLLVVLQKRSGKST